MISDEVLRRWLYGEPAINVVNVTLSTTPQMVLPANPTRFSLVMPHSLSTNTWYALTEVPMTTNTIQFYWPSSDGTYPLTYDQMGGAICLPLWCAIASGTLNLQIIEVSVNPNRWAKYKELENRVISQF